MAIYKRGKWYWMHDFVNGVEYRMTLNTRNWQEALKRHKEKLNEIAEGKLGAVGRAAQKDFNSAADAYLEERRLHTAEKHDSRMKSDAVRFVLSSVTFSCDESRARRLLNIRLPAVKRECLAEP
jgi:hypothetical protein